MMTPPGDSNRLRNAILARVLFLQSQNFIDDQAYDLSMFRADIEQEAERLLRYTRLLCVAVLLVIFQMLSNLIRL
jgi:hypothetical protein